MITFQFSIQGIAHSTMPAVIITPQRWAVRSAQAAQAMRDAKPLVYQGKRSNEPATTRGRSVAYLASRLRRDHPDIADRVQAGEFYSIRSAAVAAGIIKPQAMQSDGQDGHAAASE